MRFGVATDFQLDINYQLGLFIIDFIHLAGTRPRTNCNRRPGKKCTVCPPLLPKLVLGPCGSWVIPAQATPSPALVSTMVTSALQIFGVHSKAFTGASCRMGGLTVATEAGVPESNL